MHDKWHSKNRNNILNSFRCHQPGHILREWGQSRPRALATIGTSSVFTPGPPIPRYAPSAPPTPIQTPSLHIKEQPKPMPLWRQFTTVSLKANRLDYSQTWRARVFKEANCLGVSSRSWSHLTYTYFTCIPCWGYRVRAHGHHVIRQTVVYRSLYI